MNLAEHSKAELRAKADDLGLDVAKSATKGQLIAAIEQASPPAANPDPDPAPDAPADAVRPDVPEPTIARPGDVTPDPKEHTGAPDPGETPASKLHAPDFDPDVTYRARHDITVSVFGSLQHYKAGQTIPRNVARQIVPEGAPVDAEAATD